MSDRDFAMALALLAEAFGEKGLTPVRIDAYHKSLQDVPLPLLRAAVQRAINTREWFPKVKQLREDAEACRLELMARNKYEPCQACVGGWVTVKIEGASFAQHCDCFTSHLARLDSLGLVARPVAQLVDASRDWHDRD